MSEMRRSALLTAIAAALSGCMVGPDYTRPKIDAPQTFRYADRDARALADTPWWTQFGDPVLDSYIAEAIASNKNLQIAAANVLAANAVFTQARSGLFPQVGYQGEAVRQRFSERGATPLAGNIPNPQDAYQALLGASWEIDLWGRVRRLSEAARANALATEEARRGVILSLVAAVATTYIQLRSLDYQLEIAKRELASYAESVSLFELQFKYGQVSQLTVEQSRSQYETAAIAIPQIERSIAQTENALSILLGRNPGPIARGKPLGDLALPGVPEGMPSQLLERRPDIAQAEQQLIAANAQIGAARAQYFPSISLTGAFGSASGELSDLFSGSSRVWNYSGAITGPIFTGGLISGQVAQAKAEEQAALVNYQAVIQSAFADVENALVGRETLARQIQAEQRRVKALGEYARLARLQYDGGYTDYLTVLSAQEQLFPAELNYAQDLGQTYTSLVDIYKARGGGWVDKAGALATERATPAAAVPAEPNKEAEPATAGQQPSSTTAEAAADTAAPTAEQDRTAVVQEGAASVLNVYRVRGIGGVEMRPPSAGWPPSVLVRLHGFPALESFTAKAASGTLVCETQRAESGPPAEVCRLGATRVDAVRKVGDTYEVALPAALLARSTPVLELRWVDQWR